MKLFDEIPYLENDLIILRKIEECDAKVLEQMSSNPNVRKYLPTFLLEYQYEDKREAIRKMYEEAFPNKESLYLGVYLKTSPDTLAGVAEFYNYDPNWNKVSIGCRINEPYWNQHIGKSMVSLMKDYLLNKTDVKRITAHVMTENQYSGKMVESSGFRMRRQNVKEDWGFEAPVLVNKYILEKWGGIRYVKIGNGPKVMVILPGLALKSTLGAADAISKNYSIFQDYSIYLFDDRENIGENYTIRERAGDVAAEMKTLGLKRACVFGASMGGMVGQYLAIDHPDLVDRLFLSATCSRMNQTAACVIGRWLDLAEKHDLKTLTSDMIDGIYSPAIVARFGKVLKEGIGEISQDDLEKFMILAKAILRVNTYDELDKIKCPVMAVGAQGDRVLTPVGVQEIADRIHCEIYLYGAEFGHGVYDEAPDHRNLILSFFNR